MAKYDEHSAPSTAAAVVVTVLACGIIALLACGVVGFMLYRTAAQKAMVAREQALRAQAQAVKAAEHARLRAEEAAQEAGRQSQSAAEEIPDHDAETMPVDGSAATDAKELQIEVDAEGHMSVNGEGLDWEQAAQRLRELEGQPSPQVLIRADKHCRMEPVLKLLQAAEEIGVEATLSELPPNADQSN